MQSRSTSTSVRTRRAAWALGIALEVIALLGLLAWAQASDPHCAAGDTALSMQRLCDGGNDPAGVSSACLVPIFVALAIGMGCHRWGAKRWRREAGADLGQAKRAQRN